MAFQPVPNTCSFVVEYGNTAKQWTNTFYATHSSWNTTLQLQIANAILLDLGDELMPEICDAYYLRKVTSYDLRSEDGPVVVSTATQVQGSKTDPSMAVNACMVVTLRTGARGRSGRGRHYVSGFTEAQGGGAAFVLQALADAVEAAYTSVHNLLDGLGVDLVVVQRYSEGVKLATAVTRSITQFEVRNLEYGSQRRRIGRE
jgi:hypothetical protein